MLMTLRRGALAALLGSAAVPSLAQDADGGVFQLVPGTVVVAVPESGLVYQVPATIAVEVCPSLDQAYLVSDFEGTTTVVCEVTQAQADEREFGGFPSSNFSDDESGVDPSTGAGTDDAAGGGVDAGTGAGTDAAPGTEPGTESGTEAGSGTDAVTETTPDAGAGAGADAGTAPETSPDAGAEAGAGGSTEGGATEGGAAEGGSTDDGSTSDSTDGGSEASTGG